MSDIVSASVEKDCDHTIVEAKRCNSALQAGAAMYAR